jgi:hypothetical protein
MNYFADLVAQSLSRAKESTLSVLGITNPALRKHLQDQMQSPCGDEGSFLASPLFEHTFGWTPSSSTLNTLVKDKLLSKKVVDSLDKKTVTNATGVEVSNKYQFKAEYYPYTHQLESWNTLLCEEVKSVVVTSGTGSGKTECFMVPVLEDLYREQQIKQEKLEGVRAIFLYPLNALINSQRERLHAWTQDFGSDIRFCLYNGNTEEKENRMRSKQSSIPNEIHSRELMRKEPAPILVTNGTMLEYMLIRNVDAPIISKSKAEKSLRWIILDEAHTYVGSQAAELSMQLRRVLQAFGVEAKNVRFVATSATIADDDGEGQLQSFLAELAGVPESQVIVIGGKRAIPSLTFENSDNISFADMCSIPADIPKKSEDFDPEVSVARFNALCQSKTAKTIRDKFVTSDKPIKLTVIVEYLNATFPEQAFNQTTVLQWLDLLTGTKKDIGSQAFLKVRAHFFQRMLNGLWSCIDPNCEAKTSSVLNGHWPFGNVYVSQRSRCNCGAPVCEVGFCNDCNEPHLLAIEKNGVIAHREANTSDEFSLLVDDDENNDISANDEGKIREASPVKKETRHSSPITLRAEANDNGSFIGVGINKTNGNIGGLDEKIKLYLFQNYENECGKCEYKGFSGRKPIRRAMLGAPFYVANAVPTLLEFCPDPAVDKGSNLGPNSLPGRGRKLITFTDSRQGTARMAVRMQQEAERSKLRGLVFEVLKKKQLDARVENKISQEEIEALESQVERLLNAGLKDIAKEKQDEIDQANLSTSIFTPAVLSWTDLVKSLQLSNDIKNGMLDYNKYANPEVFDTSSGPQKLAEMLLMREFARRPKRQNNLETQGIVKLGYVGLDKVTVAPPNWESHGLTLEDWQDFLKVTLDFYVRENTYIKLEDDWRIWIGFKFAPKTLINPTSAEEDENRVKKWPQIKTTSLNRLGKLLALGANLEASNKSDKDQMNEWLRSAWAALTTHRVLDNEGNQFYLNREKITFSFSDKFFVCPVTNKLIDTTFKGLTPYLPRNFTQGDYTCKVVNMPPIWSFDISQEDYRDGLNKIRAMVSDDKDLATLRVENLWTDINDRAIEGGYYYRTAEHSAQQSADRLKYYEDRFKEGKVNVLNCSTTMEMGVDIGGISAVVMNNVPPHPANYLQRAGRAGRSNESRAIAYTLCKSNPHDNEVFNDTAWPFVTKIPAPQISLDSARLVSRHVNSLLLSIYLREVIGATNKEKTNLNLQWFFEVEGEGLSVCEQFKAWMDASSDYIDDSIKSLVRGTALAGNEVRGIISSTKLAIGAMQERWLTQLEQLNGALDSAEKDSPFEYRISLALSRHRNEYLLKELAAKAFLPGYGFPTDVVTLNNTNIIDFRREKAGKKSKTKLREDNISQLRGMPSRNLAIAIREYAPGAQLVIDGRVFRSAGISLNWQKIGVNLKEAQRLDTAWKCAHCGQTGLYSSGEVLDEVKCSRCEHKVPPSMIKKSIQPTGFVTDFFDAPENDISTQKYIPVQPAWLSLNGKEFALPNPSIGFMSYGNNATLFQHSSGEFGTGYAVCLSCGKAESMTVDGEFPKGLSPDSEHRPITTTPNSKDSDGYQPPCDGSTSVHSNIHIGCSSLTDAFELTLKHPVTGQYIDVSDQGETIGLTLAVALRNALANKLGISTSEIGYAVRPSRVLSSNLPATVIQLYDAVSGGAGFATSAARFIDSLILKVIDDLKCEANCEDACSNCLLDSNTRHDANHLNRRTALDWLGAEYGKFVTLAQEFNYLKGSAYCHESIKEAISHQINKGANSVKIWLSGDVNEWDLNSRHVHMFVYQMLKVNNVELAFVVPSINLGQAERRSLLRYQELGVVLLSTNNKLSSGNMVTLISNQSTELAIASQTVSLISPNASWLDNNNEDMLVKSDVPQGFIFTQLDTSSWGDTEKGGGKRIEFSSELNGEIRTFGDRFWSLIGGSFPSLKDDLESSRLSEIKYTDRYLQSPWYIILFGELIRALPRSSNTTFELQTLFSSKQSRGKLINHDWSVSADMTDVMNLWFDKGINVPCFVDLHDDKKHISHRRELVLKFENGNEYSVGFDQGVGYWRHRLSHNRHYFDFSDVNNQLTQMYEAWNSGRVENGFDWKTVLYLNKL